MNAVVRVRVCRVMQGQVQCRALDVPAGACVADALAAAGWSAGLVPASVAVGVYGVRVEPSQMLFDGDRVELYHALPTDPKERRRHRAGRLRP